MRVNSLQLHDFAVLAKRLSAWTTNSLFTLLVVVAGVGFGRQVTSWWAADASPPPAVAAGLDDPAQVQMLQFGDASWSLRRQSVMGNKQKAIEQLRAACRQVLLAGPSVDQSPADDRFLKLLASCTPVDQEPGKWRLYELHDAFPMTVGVLARANAQDRVAVWGLAVPTGAKQWTLNTFQQLPSAVGNSNAINVPLPPGCRRTLSLSTESGRIIAFRGPDCPSEWKGFYDDWFASQGGQRAAPWRLVGSAWCAKFSDRGEWIDVRFGPDGQGGLSGMLMTTPDHSRPR